jgi:outer membrane receptor protein involved in Fe transport
LLRPFFINVTGAQTAAVFVLGVARMKLYRHLSATALATVCVASIPAFAQSTTAAPEEATESREAILVTGSRIKRAGFDTLEPATVVSKEYLDTRGLTNVADALNEIPGFGVGVNPDGNQSTFGVGQNFVSRFGLGSARTLTLVNGRRFVSTNAPSIFGNTPGLQVDLNVIPSEMVDRIENLAIGGAPTYGSDAIAGTVNVILKKNYEGFSIQGLGGITQRGDNGRYSVSALVGQNYGDGRGNITMAVSYDRANGVLAGSRSIFQQGIATGTNPLATSASALLPGRTPGTDGRVNPNIPFNTGNADGIPNSVYIRNARIFSLTTGGLLLPATGATTIASGLPRGFGANNLLLQFDPSGNLVTYNPGVPFGAQNASGGDGWNLVGDTSQITSTLERITGNVIANYELTDGVNAFFEGTYYFARGFELIDQSIFNATLFGGNSAPLTFQATDPRLTAQARATLANNGITSFRLSRASSDLVNNNASGETNVYRGVAGFNGDFTVAGRDWNYEVSANWGRSVSTFRANVLNQQKFVNAINNCQVAGVTAANNVAPGGLLPIADTACVPLDVFGQGRASAAAKAYVTGVTNARAFIEQQVYSASVGTSSLFTLWAGDVGVNIGVEHRIEKASFKPDAFQRAGLGRSVPIGGNYGKFSTKEAYGELLIPLVSPANNVPLIESLDLEAKGRYVDNSVNGGFWAYTFGGRYRPIRDIELRGNYTRSLRAPSVVELFTPQSPAFNTFPDPCDSVNIASGPNPTVRAANCAAFFASYGLNGASFNSLARVATVPVVSGGNTSLANEQGRAYTFGVVLRPSFVPRFRAAVDWNRIRITGNIASLTPANIAEGCYDNPSFNAADVDNANPFCSLIRRDRTPADPTRNGQLSIVNTRPALVSTYVNGAFIEFKGLTAEVDYNFPLDAIGINDTRIDLGGSLFYLESLRQSNNGVTVVENQRTLGNPEFAGQVSLGVTYKDFGIDLQANYQSPQQFDRTFNVETRDILKVRDYWLFNGSMTMKVQKDSIMRFAVSNLFDRDPPFPLTTNGLGIYDYLGRRFTMSFEHKF